VDKRQCIHHPSANEVDALALIHPTESASQLGKIPEY